MSASAIPYNMLIQFILKDTNLEFGGLRAFRDYDFLNRLFVLTVLHTFLHPPGEKDILLNAAKKCTGHQAAIII